MKVVAYLIDNEVVSVCKYSDIGENITYIENLHTEENNRRKGFATKLMKMVLLDCRKKIQLTATKKSFHLFEKLGFYPISDWNENLIIMEYEKNKK